MSEKTEWGDSSNVEPKRLLSVPLVEAADTPNARRGVVNYLVNLVHRIWDVVPEARKQTRGRRAALDTAKLIAEAASGRAEGMALEGDKALAEIKERYANARKLNAEAGLIELQAAAKRQELLTQSLRRQGFDILVDRDAEGRPRIVIVPRDPVQLEELRRLLDEDYLELGDAGS